MNDTSRSAAQSQSPHLLSIHTYAHLPEANQAGELGGLQRLEGLIPGSVCGVSARVICIALNCAWTGSGIALCVTVDESSGGLVSVGLSSHTHIGLRIGLPAFSLPYTNIRITLFFCITSRTARSRRGTRLLRSAASWASSPPPAYVYDL